MIHCKNIVKRFNDLLAADNISIHVTTGICALVGPNGAGKSTLLKILTGLLHPDAGSVRIADLNIATQTLEARRIMGVVPEDLGLLNSLTVMEHLEMTGPIYGLSRRETRERGKSLLRAFGLSSAADLFLDQCSHGMRKKTALAMALLHNPKVLFLDEPFEGIDPSSARSIQKLLLAISKRGITVFFTSHMLWMVEQLATEVLLIQSGRIVWQSGKQAVAKPLEELYFELVEAPPSSEDLTWLQSSPL